MPNLEEFAAAQEYHCFWCELAPDILAQVEDFSNKWKAQTDRWPDAMIRKFLSAPASRDGAGLELPAKMPRLRDHMNFHGSRRNAGP